MKQVIKNPKIALVREKFLVVTGTWMLVFM